MSTETEARLDFKEKWKEQLRKCKPSKSARKSLQGRLRKLGLAEKDRRAKLEVVRQEEEGE